jgi:hypothetical protein
MLALFSQSLMRRYRGLIPDLDRSELTTIMDRQTRRHLRCQFCKWKPVVFAKAHVIPRSFFHLFKGKELNSIVVDIERKRIEKKQAGYSDPAMLCRECEAKFNPLDNYGFKILGRSNLIEKPLYHKGFPYAYEINCETDKLHRFLLSVLWRASVSDLPAFSNVQLWQHQGPLLHDIFASSPIDSQRYQTIVFKLDGDFLGPFSHSMFEPLASFQKDKSAMCQLYLPYLKAVTFIGSRVNIPDWMRLVDPGRAILPRLHTGNSGVEWQFLDRIHQAYHAEKSAFH